MITVKEAGSADIPAIQQLATITWATAYASILPQEQMSYMLDLFYSTNSLQKQMDEGHRFIMAMDSGEAVGFASWSLKADSLAVYRLHKIYIAPNQQGKGVGKSLFDFILSDIKSHNATDLELNVNRYNKARQFYEKIGFVVVNEEDVDIGNGYFMNDYVMNLKVSRKDAKDSQSR